jgi:Lrp/AsnC family leucine-responsive transcriptional regulator
MRDLSNTIRSMPALDATDVRLLQLLQEDCKQSLAKLGDAVGLSAPSVMERVRKLEKGGVIRGYHALVDGRRVGLDVTAFIGVSFNFPKEIDQFESQVEAMAEVLEVHHVTGGPTMLLKVKCASTAALEGVINRLRVLEGVMRTETMVVLSTRTERIAVPLDDAADDEEPVARRRRTRAAS